MEKVNDTPHSKAVIHPPVALKSEKFQRGRMTVESQYDACQHWSKGNIPTSDKVQKSRGKVGYSTGWSLRDLHDFSI